MPFFFLCGNMRALDFNLLSSDNCLDFKAQGYNDLQHLFWSLNRIELVLPANGVGSSDWHPFTSPCETHWFNNRKSDLVYKIF